MVGLSPPRGAAGDGSSSSRALPKGDVLQKVGFREHFCVLGHHQVPLGSSARVLQPPLLRRAMKSVPC